MVHHNIYDIARQNVPSMVQTWCAQCTGIRRAAWIGAWCGVVRRLRAILVCDSCVHVPTFAVFQREMSSLKSRLPSKRALMLVTSLVFHSPMWPYSSIARGRSRNQSSHATLMAASSRCCHQCARACVRAHVSCARVLCTCPS